jgi:hypothetical protein
LGKGAPTILSVGKIAAAPCPPLIVVRGDFAHPTRHHDFRFVFRLVLRLLPAVFFFGTFLPLRRASDSPIAIACLRLFTFLPLRPLLRVPFLRFRIARLTSDEALFEYFRAMALTFAG